MGRISEAKHAEAYSEQEEYAFQMALEMVKAAFPVGGGYKRVYPEAIAEGMTRAALVIAQAADPTAYGVLFTTERLEEVEVRS